MARYIIRCLRCKYERKRIHAQTGWCIGCLSQLSGLLTLVRNGVVNSVEEFLGKQGEIK